MITNKSIYDLKLHEELKLSNDMYVLRVPGGWIYDFWDVTKDQAKIGVFVPFSMEIIPNPVVMSISEYEQMSDEEKLNLYKK